MKIPTPRRRGDGWRIEVCVKGTRDSATFDTQADAFAALLDRLGITER